MVADTGAAPTFLELAAGAEHHARGNPVGAMTQRAGLTRRTFTRRPRAATGHLPMDCVHALRLVKAKRVIEQDAGGIDDVAYNVGCEDPTFLRRLHRREAGLAPAACRREIRASSSTRQAQRARPEERPALERELDRLRLAWRLRAVGRSSG